MLHRIRLGISFSTAALVVALLAVQAPAQTPQGKRIYFSGHSFHVFMPGILNDIAKKADIKDHTQLGLSSIGGSRVIQHWNPPVTIIPKDAKDTALPTDTIAVLSTARFPASGEITVKTADGDTVVTYTGIKGNTFTGCKGGKGTLSAGKVVNTTTTAAREALKTGKVDVFTMAPIYLPDDGIEKHVKLAIDNNPKIRIFVQENWLPWDHFDVTFKGPKEKVDHNAPTAESLKKLHAPYFKMFDDHVADLNKKFDTNAVRVAPIGQAVNALREKILAGKAPGLKEQNDLFSDPIGHAKAPLQALSGYCYYALIYEKSPVGLPAPGVLGKASPELNRLLQEIAWDAVTSHPLSGVKAK